MKHDLRYGGTYAGKQELDAIIKSVTQSIRTGNWQAGEQAKLFEQEAADFLGVKHGVLTTSGSCAGLLALSALELPKGSEVIIPAVTFPTIFNIILQCNLVPVVVDVGTDYVLDVDVIEDAISKKTKAIIAVHALGYPVDMKHLMKIAKKNNLKVIEDNCDGWGGSIGGKKLGAWGDVSITSFHGAHIVSTAGTGGGVFTNDAELAQKVRMYKDWGRQADTTKPNVYRELPADYNPRFIYEKIGYNFQTLELQAAMGRIQLQKADKIKKLRQRNANCLIRELSKFEELILPSPDVKNADICWFSLPITTIGDRGLLVKHLEDNGIETRSMFSGNIIVHPAYRDSDYKVPGPLDNANYILEHSFWITVNPRLRKSDLDYIVSVFKSFYGKN